ncbi:serine/threonine protein phosphatase CPPED1, putative [Plasmodium gallinaceum]|uniref:Serine/threonine protein phosphatase CPPED1, putative n=1 Tax=Plasmodium gallinaceum TaxID=5849 RepID=A0A1J1GX10_PLAGA|nr:serine/threonine protein phosphatase CPPED1, putative [Plasmodium gallinaceum]CRG95559.1 serine/threonine protein phosphatase CPPED1, putative [Plasmodium gallinaceum]
MVLIKVQNNQGKSINENSFSPFYFILYGDIQYGMLRSDIGWFEERILLKKAIEKTNKLKPPFVIAMGDLSNANPSTEAQNEQYNDLKEDFKLLNKSIDLYVFCGNHDVGNSPTCETIKKYEDVWGDGYYSFIYNNCGFIILNSSILYDDTYVKSLRDKQLEWLEETLKKMQSLNLKYKFIFMHHPLMYDNIDEDENIGLIYVDKIRLYVDKNRFHIKKETRLIIYELMKKYNVNHIFCAHLHFNKEGNIDSNIKQIVISAVGMQVRDDKSGILIVQVNEKNVDYKYYPFDYIPNMISN